MSVKVSTIVAQGESVGFVGAFPLTTLFTPDTDGMFVLHLYHEVPVGSNPTMQLKASWTDGSGPKSYAYDNYDSTNYQSLSLPIFATAGNPIQLSSQFGLLTDPQTFRWTVEAL